MISKKNKIKISQTVHLFEGCWACGSCREEEKELGGKGCGASASQSGAQRRIVKKISFSAHFRTAVFFFQKISKRSNNQEF